MSAFFFAVNAIIMIGKSIHLLILLFIHVPAFAQESNQSIILNEIVQLIGDFDDSENIFYVRLEPAGSEAYVELTNLLISRWPALNFTRSEVNATHELLFHVDTEITLSRISKTEYNHAIKGTATLQVTSASTQIITHSNRLSITYQNRIHASKIEQLASAWYPARVHQQNDNRPFVFLRRVFEPLAISSAILTTVYLLYNVRSS